MSHVWPKNWWFHVLIITWVITWKVVLLVGYKNNKENKIFISQIRFKSDQTSSLYSRLWKDIFLHFLMNILSALRDTARNIKAHWFWKNEIKWSVEYVITAESANYSYCKAFYLWIIFICADAIPFRFCTSLFSVHWFVFLVNYEIILLFFISLLTTLIFSEFIPCGT